MTTKAPIAASGYEALQSTPLGGGIVYGGTIRDRNWESDLIPYICNTQILDDLIKCGQVIEFMKPAQVGAWREYELDQALIPDQVVPDSTCLSICNMVYKALKFDKESIRRACERWDDFEEDFLYRCWQELSAVWHRFVITDMILLASANNKGNKAGRFRNINLGSIGNPIELTPENIVIFMAKMSELFAELGRWYAGEMFMLVPRAFNTLMLQSMFEKQWCCDPDNSVQVKGYRAENIQGFRVFETEHLQATVGTDGQLIFPIVAGWQDAYGFAGDLIEAEIANLSADSFGVIYKMLAIFGGGAIYPDALAVAYVTFSTNGTV